MLKSFFRSPLRLDVDGHTITFGGIVDFEFSLASRTEVPAGKIAELVRLSQDELLREATSIRRTERYFVDILARSIEEPGSIGHLLRMADKKLFSQDHRWRTIMMALDQRGEEFDEFKKIALVRYIQYLGSRQDVLKSIYAYRRQPGVESAPEPAPAMDTALKETVIFDLSQGPGGGAGSQPFERLPRGETVTIRIPRDTEMDIMLSHNPFKLVPGEHFYLVDERGADYLLGRGKNVVGRELGNEVVIDAGYRDVSRRHLIIEPLDADTALLTDLSSHGTYIPPGYAQERDGAA